MILLGKRISLPFAIVSLALLLATPAQAAVSAEVRAQLEAMDIKVFVSGDIPYFSTGVGVEAREAEYPPFSLKVILATEQGAYISNVAIKIAPEGGKPVVDAVAEGPWFFVDLETGSYRVEATASDVKKVFSGIMVRKGQTRTLTIYWPADAVK